MLAAKKWTIPCPHYMEKTLTEIEAIGLTSRYDLANGHASHELTQAQQDIIMTLPELWYGGLSQTSGEAERRFKQAFHVLANCPSLVDYNHFKICPTASNSIDVVAAWLAEHKLRTALIEPTFDNLYLILKRRGVALTPLPEPILHSEDVGHRLNDIDAIFLVNPNNPTGKIISRDLFVKITDWCVRQHKVLIIDNSFRFFVEQTYDHYQILLDSGVTFLSIEDTGKVWPTQEIKASLLVTSFNIFHDIELIYDEIFLCHSNFSLNILTAFLHDANRRGLDEVVWNQVAQRRQQFRAVLNETILSVHEESLTSTLSVEWVRVDDIFVTDLEIAEHFRALNLILLPGRQFYWSRQAEYTRLDSVRFALLKPKNEFLSAIACLGNELKRLKL